MKLIRLKQAGLIAVLGVLSLTFMAQSGCDKAKSAAVANNRYLESLQHFRDAEKSEYEAGRISDEQQGRIIQAERDANEAAKDLNKASKLIEAGADPQQILDAAEASFSQMEAVVGKDDKALNALVQVSGDLLKNAISLDQALKAQKGGN